MRHIILFTIVWLLACPVWAEHPITVEQAMVQGDYLKALADFDKLPSQATTVQASIAAMKSAWALGMPNRAIELIEGILQDKKITEDQRIELLVTRGIIELQEGKPQGAILYAQKARGLCGENCRLNAALEYLWGDALANLSAFGAAEDHFSRGLETATSQDEAEGLYRRGIARLKLGRLQEAREDLEKIPVGSERTGPALRTLVDIALTLGDYKATDVWLKKGMSSYPEQFYDSWASYAVTKVAIAMKDLPRVQKVRKEAEVRFPASDAWLILLEAEAEQFVWDQDKQERGGR